MKQHIEALLSAGNHKFTRQPDGSVKVTHKGKVKYTASQEPFGVHVKYPRGSEYSHTNMHGAKLETFIHNAKIRAAISTLESAKIGQ